MPGRLTTRKRLRAAAQGARQAGGKAPRDADRDGKVFDGTARERPAPQPASLSTPLRRRQAARARHTESPEVRARMARRLKRERARAQASADRLDAKHVAKREKRIAKWKARQEKRHEKYQEGFRKRQARKGVAPEKIEARSGILRERFRGRLKEAEMEVRSGDAFQRRDARQDALRYARKNHERLRKDRRTRRADGIVERRVGKLRAKEIRLQRVMNSHPGTAKGYRENAQYRRETRERWGLDPNG